MSVRLEPPSLGRVQLDVTMERNNLAVRIRIDTESVRQVLADSLPELREALVRQGMNVQDISLALDQDSGASTSYRGESGFGEGRGDEGPPDGGGEPEREVSAPTRGPVQAAAGGRKVDFFA